MNSSIPIKNVSNMIISLKKYLSMHSQLKMYHKKSFRKNYVKLETSFIDILLSIYTDGFMEREPIKCPSDGV